MQFAKTQRIPEQQFVITLKLNIILSILENIERVPTRVYHVEQNKPKGEYKYQMFSLICGILGNKKRG